MDVGLDVVSWKTRAQVPSCPGLRYFVSCRYPMPSLIETQARWICICLLWWVCPMCESVRKTNLSLLDAESTSSNQAGKENMHSLYTSQAGNPFLSRTSFSSTGAQLPRYHLCPRIFSRQTTTILTCSAQHTSPAPRATHASAGARPKIHRPLRGRPPPRSGPRSRPMSPRPPRPRPPQWGWRVAVSPATLATSRASMPAAASGVVLSLP